MDSPNARISRMKKTSCWRTDETNLPKTQRAVEEQVLNGETFLRLSASVPLSPASVSTPVATKKTAAAAKAAAAARATSSAR